MKKYKGQKADTDERDKNNHMLVVTIVLRTRERMAGMLLYC